MPEDKAIRLPQRVEMLRRLRSVTTVSHVREVLHPKMAKYAGQEKTGAGIHLMVAMAIRDYIRDFPPVMGALLRRDIPKYLRALIDDAEVLADALHAHEETK